MRCFLGSNDSYRWSWEKILTSCYSALFAWFCALKSWTTLLCYRLYSSFCLISGSKRPFMKVWRSSAPSFVSYTRSLRTVLSLNFVFDCCQIERFASCSKSSSYFSTSFILFIRSCKCGLLLYRGLFLSSSYTLIFSSSFSLTSLIYAVM